MKYIYIFILQFQEENRSACDTKHTYIKLQKRGIELEVWSQYGMLSIEYLMLLKQW